MARTPARETLNLYRRVEAVLRDQIAEGVFASGMRMPSEAALQAAHKVSRGTIRQALEALEQDNLIVRQPGRGTFVRNRPSGPQVRPRLPVQEALDAQKEGAPAGTSPHPAHARRRGRHPAAPHTHPARSPASQSSSGARPPGDGAATPTLCRKIGAAHEADPNLQNAEKFTALMHDSRSLP